MNATAAATHWEVGNYATCGCEAPQINGESCFVGATFPGMAFFGKVTGDAFCAAQGNLASQWFV